MTHTHIQTLMKLKKLGTYLIYYLPMSCSLSNHLVPFCPASPLPIDWSCPCHFPAGKKASTLACLVLFLTCNPHADIFLFKDLEWFVRNQLSRHKDEYVIYSLFHTPLISCYHIHLFSKQSLNVSPY